MPRGPQPEWAWNGLSEATSPRELANATDSHRLPEGAHSRAIPSPSCPRPRLVDNQSLRAYLTRISSLRLGLLESSDTKGTRPDTRSKRSTCLGHRHSSGGSPEAQFAFPQFRVAWQLA